MKKLLALFIAGLMLMTFGISSAFAQADETVTTITCKPGAQLAGDTTLMQICETAAIRLYSMAEEYGAFVLVLGGEDVLSALFRIVDDGIFVQTQAMARNRCISGGTIFRRSLKSRCKTIPIWRNIWTCSMATTSSP